MLGTWVEPIIVLRASRVPRTCPSGLDGPGHQVTYYNELYTNGRH